MHKLRDIYLRRCELFLDPNHMSDQNIHQSVFRHRDSTVVQLEVWSVPVDQPGDPLPPKFDEATRQSFRPAQVGDQFGPSWSTHWFKVNVTIPNDKAWIGNPVVFRWDAGCEALLWSATGIPLQGFSDSSRCEFVLTEASRPSECFQFYIVHY